jgi:hypothetical protein
MRSIQFTGQIFEGRAAGPRTRSGSGRGSSSRYAAIGHAGPRGVMMSKYSVGDRVVQPNYGPGTITTTDESRTVIDFDEHGVRMFATAMVTLERTDTPAPARAKARRAKSVAAAAKA